MTNSYKIRDSDGTVIGQYHQNSEPQKPDEHDGEWNVERVDEADLNSEPVEWWDLQ